MARTIMARTIKVLGLMLLIATMSGTAARAQSEAYPPSNVLLALDPVACDATAITGNPDECREQMEQFFAAGVDEIRLVFNEPNGSALRDAIEAVAPGK